MPRNNNVYNPYKNLNTASKLAIGTEPTYIKNINQFKRGMEERNINAFIKSQKRNMPKLTKNPRKSFLKSRKKRLKNRHPNNIFSRVSSNGRVIKKTEKLLLFYRVIIL